MRRHLHRALGAAVRSELSSTLTSTRWSRPRSARTSGRSSATSTLDPAARSGRASRARGDDLVERHRLRSDAEGPGLQPARIEQVADHAVEAIGSSPRSSRAARRAPRSDHSTSVWRRQLTAALIPASGVRRSWPTAASSEVRCSSTVASERACSASPLSTCPRMRCARRRRTRRARAGLRRTAPGRGRATATRGPTATSKRSGASSPGGAQPACSTSRHSSAPPRARLERHRLHAEGLTSPLEHVAKRILAVEVGAGKRRHRLGLGPGALGRLRSPDGELDRAADQHRPRPRR